MLYNHTYMWNLEKANTQKQRVDGDYQGWEDVRSGEMLVKGYKVTIVQDTQVQKCKVQHDDCG